MARTEDDATLRILFGKAFLVELDRGDTETAKVFARAFLLATNRNKSRAAVTPSVAS